MPDMTHAQLTRMIWIDGRLVGAGCLNRADLIAAFGISHSQAAADIQRYERLHPGRLHYNRSAKLYHTRKGTGPAFSASDRLAVMHAVQAVTDRMALLEGITHA